jgi:signal transduction histidine kinase
MGFIFVASYFFIRTIINPVKELQKAVQEVKKGNLAIKIPVKRMDELGELSVQFNAMAEQLTQIFKLKDQLLLDVSHELRSPLTRIKVALEFVKEDKIKQTLAEEVDGMESMIQEILETARLDSPHGKLQLEKIRLFSFLKNIVHLMSSRKPGLELKPRRDNLVIGADLRRLSMMFGNIIDNALRYSEHQIYPVVLRIIRLKEGIKVSIRDFGCGIPAQDLPYIFEPFYRVDPSRSKETGGYGIGFFLSKRIAEAHGAKIHICSSEGKGTEVTVIFPPALMAKSK